MTRIGTADHILPFAGGSDVDVWEATDGRRFCVSEWNDEEWIECWEILPDMSGGLFSQRGFVYRYEEEGIDISSLEKITPSGDHYTEIVGLEL